MSEEGYGPADTHNYDFGNPAAPEGFDPNAGGWIDPAPGIHEMRLTTFKVMENKEFGWSGDTYVLNQLRPQFECVHGPGKITDFLPIPTRGRTMHSGLANRWANLLKSLGFDMPKNAVIPDGFNLNDIIGKTAMVSVEVDTDRDKVIKTKANGHPRMTVGFFGYSPVGSIQGTTNVIGKPAHNHDPSAQNPPASFDL